MSELAIKARGVRKTYGRFVALKNIDLDVKAGVVYGFLGPNGAGKTTLIKILLGLSIPKDGEVEIFGKDLFLERNTILKSVGAVVEAPAFFEYMTAYENLYYLTRLSGPVSREKIEDTLKVVGLDDVAGKRVGAFSYGMKQRLGIANALLPENKLIFLDEPTNGLDPHGILGVRQLIRRLCRDSGITIFISSHMLAEIEQVCDYVTIIDRGEKVCEAKVSDLVERQSRIEFKTGDAERGAEFFRKGNVEVIEERKHYDSSVFILKGHETEIPELARRLVSAGIGILKISKHKDTLEDVFVEITGKNKTDSASDRF
ncbi:MAG: ABC transporter ATP-binding protein [Victivallales bacterium]